MGLGASMSALMSARAVSLVRRELVGKARLHLELGRRIRREGVARDRGAPGVEVDEVEGEALRGLAGLSRGARPVGGVEAGEARRAPVRAHVARDAVDLLERHEELVPARILQEEVVALASLPPPAERCLRRARCRAWRGPRSRPA
jgi:hypothetical protein